MKNIYTICFLLIVQSGFAQWQGTSPVYTSAGVKVGIGVNNPNSNLQIGSGTVDGLVNLGGYSFVGNIRSSGDLFAGTNAYALYSSTSENQNIRVFNSNSSGFSALQLGYTGEISFYSRGGSVVANDLANTTANLKMRILNNGYVGLNTPTPNYPLDVKGDLNLDDGGINYDLRIRLHQKAALASYNTQGGANDVLYINRDWASGPAYHSDFNAVKIYSQGLPLDVIGDLNVEDDGSNRDLRIRLHQKAALASYNTQGSPNNILYINRDWSSGASYHSDFDVVSVYGNVGIGTFSPDSKLTVKGKIHAEEVLVDLNVPGPDYVFEKDYDLLSLPEIEKYINDNKHLPEVPSAKEMEENGLNLKEMNLILLKKVEELTLHLIEIKKNEEQLKNELSSLKEEVKNIQINK